MRPRSKPRALPDAQAPPLPSMERWALKRWKIGNMKRPCKEIWRQGNCSTVQFQINKHMLHHFEVLLMFDTEKRPREFDRKPAPVPRKKYVLGGGKISPQPRGRGEITDLVDFHSYETNRVKQAGKFHCPPQMGACEDSTSD